MGGRFHGRNNPPKEKKPLKDTFDLKTLRMKFRAKIAAAMAVAFAFATQTVHAQNVGVKANALSFAHTALGMGAEMSLGYHWSAELYGIISPWKRTEDKAKKYWAVQPEVRYWPCQSMVGHFFGVHVDGAQYNVGGAAPFFGLPKSVKDARYEGWLAGGGVTYGYQWVLGRHWNAEAAVSVGYEHLRYKKFESPEKCAPQVGERSHNYWDLPSSRQVSSTYSDTMITHKIYHSLIAALIGAATTGAVQAAPIPAMGLRFVAAEAGDSSISVRSARVLPHERSMIVSMCIRVDRDLKGTESIELRPVLTDSTGHSAVLPSIFINGRTQHIAFQRDRRNAKRDLVTLRRRNGMEQTIDYLREVAYQPWMRKATLVLEEVACGCGIPIAYDSHAVATLRSDDTPRLAFRIPEVEEVKTRQESGRAFLAFQLGKSEILDNFRSNATELAKIMQAIDLVRNDSNVTVSHIAIHGYASPDGSLALNEKLSAERTQALKSWVMSKYQFDEALFTTAHTAEDWEGLVNFLRNNNTLEGREEILNIIATVGDLDKREARIREEFPSQYRFMLDNWYPFLRHSDYTVGYIVRPFTVEEAKRELKLHPQNLSIDEMFRIAQTYKEGSKEYNEVFLIAVKQNPDHPVANLNAACIALRAGDKTAAAGYLEKAMPCAERDLATGVLRMMEGHVEEAERLFEAADKAGLREEARHNLRILHPERY